MSNLLSITGLYTDLKSIWLEATIQNGTSLTTCICGGSIALMKMREESPDSVEYRTI